MFCSLTAESDVSLMNNFRYLQPVRTVDADGEVTITSKPRSPEERRAMDGKGKTEMGEWLRQHLPLKCSTAPPLFASCSITVIRYLVTVLPGLPCLASLCGPAR